MFYYVSAICVVSSHLNSECRVTWMFKEEPSPRKIIDARSTSKQRVTGFFRITGYLATLPLKELAYHSEW